MPYRIEDFQKQGLYQESTAKDIDIRLSGGKVITKLPDRLRSLLSETGGGKFDDKSRQDSKVIASLLSHGISAADCYATFSNSPRGKDALERKNGHFDDYLQRTINKAAQFISVKKPSSNGHSSSKVSIDFGRTRELPEGEGLITVKASEVEIETPRWVWPGYIPAGKMTILAGDPGLGKSTISIDLVSRISRGTFLPHGNQRTIAGNCLIASAEDAPEDTIVPRLIACNANLSKIEIMRQVKIDEEIFFISFPRDLGHLRETIIKKGIRFVVIDPFNAFLGKETDSYKDQDIRLVLAPFENIAEETGAAVVIVAHLTKKEDASTLYRVGGSIGLVGAARSILAVTRVPEKDTRVLYSLKSTLSKIPQSLEYETKEVKKNKGEKQQWLGEEKVVSSMIRWIGPIDFDPKQGTAIKQEKAEEAVEEFLRQVISDSEMKTDDIFREAREAGFSKSQLMRVKDILGIKAVKKKGVWWWRLD